MSEMYKYYSFDRLLLILLSMASRVQILWLELLRKTHFTNSIFLIGVYLLHTYPTSIDCDHDIEKKARRPRTSSKHRFAEYEEKRKKKIRQMNPHIHNDCQYLNGK